MSMGERGWDGPAVRVRTPWCMASALVLCLAVTLHGGEEAGGPDEVLLLQSSHQDIAWMDTPAACRRFRREENLLPALELLAREPELHFSIECAAYLAEALADLPERGDEIVAASRAGGLEWGATWNQPYEALLTGEQLARELLYGRGWLLRAHGIDARVAFNLDVPARPRQLPQLLARAGVVGLAAGRMPRGAWRRLAPDGSEVLAWSPGHYNHAAVRLKYWKGSRPEWAVDQLGTWRTWRRELGLPGTLPLPLLYSQDWSRPRSFADLTADGAVPGARLRYARYDELFASLAPHAERLPVLAGARPNPWCYIHGPGHQRAIAAKRRAARLLPAAELVALACRWQLGSAYPAARLRRTWLDSLADDHGWGGKHGKVTDAHFRERLESAEDAAAELIDAGLAALAAGVGGGPGVLVLNPAARARGGTVACPAPPAGRAWVDAAGVAPPQQTLTVAGEKRCLVAVPTVPACGWTVLRPGAPPAGEPEPPVIGPAGGTTDHLDLRLVPGGIAGVHDRATGRELVPPGAVWGELLLFDSPGKDVMGHWRVTPPRDLLARGRDRFGPWRVTARGRLLTELVAEGEAGPVPLALRMRVHHLAPRLDLALELTWDGTPERELRWSFPIRGVGPVTYQEPFAPLTLGRDEWTGLAVLDKHPAAAVRPREVQDLITFAGCTLVPSTAVCDVREDAEGATLQPLLLATRRSCHSEGPVYAQPGRHRFACTVLVHEPGWPQALGAGSRIARPLVAHAFARGDETPETPVPETAGLFALDRDNVRLACAKRAEDGDAIAVRLVEWYGEAGPVTLRCGFPLARAWRTDLIERGREPLPVVDGAVRLQLGAHAIETLRIEPAALDHQEVFEPRRDR